MAQEEVQAMRGLYEEWARGDFSRTDLFDPEIEHVPPGDWPDNRASRGLDALAAEMRDWLRAWEAPLVVEAEEFIEAGDRILVMIRWRGRGRGSSAQFEREEAHLWTMRDGKAIRLEAFGDRGKARAALQRVSA